MDNVDVVESNMDFNKLVPAQIEYEQNCISKKVDERSVINHEAFINNELSPINNSIIMDRLKDINNCIKIHEYAAHVLRNIKYKHNM